MTRESSKPPLSKKHKAKVIADIPEENLMEEDTLESPPQDDDTSREDEIFPQYVQQRNANAKTMTLPMKAHTILVTLMIPNCVPILKDIVSKVSKLSFRDVKTHKKEGLERKKYMLIVQA